MQLKSSCCFLTVGFYCNFVQKKNNAEINEMTLLSSDPSALSLCLSIKLGFEASQDGGLRFDNQDSTFSGPAFGFSSFGIPVRERGITALAFYNAKI